MRISFTWRNMKRRFIDRFSDVLGPMYTAFFMEAGGVVRKFARNSLKKAPLVKEADMTAVQRAILKAKRKSYKSGEDRWNTQVNGRWYSGPRPLTKPRRPQQKSKRGRPPYIHPKGEKGKSPLKNLLYFALGPSNDYVVIGPEAIGKNKRIVRQGDLSTIEELEQHRPFMEPAYEYVEPRLPQYLAKAAKKVR